MLSVTDRIIVPPRPQIRRWSIPFGRHVTYLRVSVTDRCDLRCVYCMSEDMQFLPKRELLTLEELDRVCTAFVEHGCAEASHHGRRAAGAT